MAADGKKTINQPLSKRSGKGLWKWAFIIVGLIVLMNVFYTVQEGYVGIVNKVGEAWKQSSPGLHVKIPFAETVQLIEVRNRVVQQNISSLTKEQMAVALKVSANWHVHPAVGLSFYRKYGTPEQFESRILIPQLQSITQTIVASQTTPEMLEHRENIVKAIYTTLVDVVDASLVQVSSFQIENMELPEKYQKSVALRLTEKNLIDAEKFKLDKEKVKVNAKLETAETEKEIEKAKADGDAYITIKQAEAEAEAITIKGKAETLIIEQKVQAIQQSRTFVEYMKVRKWDGMLSGNMGGHRNDLWKLQKPQE